MLIRLLVYRDFPDAIEGPRRPAFLYTAPCPKTVRVAINTGKRKLAVNRDSQAENLWHNRHPS